MNLPRYSDYKESEIGWVGEIPQHWNVGKISKYYDVQLGKMLQPEQSRGSALKPYLRSANVLWNTFNLSDVKEMYIEPTEEGQFHIRAGDLLVCEGGDVGRSAIWGGQIQECYIQNSLHRIRPKLAKSTNQYLYYCMFLANAKGEIERISNKATIAHYTLVKIKKTKIPIPSVAEQGHISRYLDTKISMINDVIRKRESQVSLLREHEKTLIHQAVTKGLDPNTPMKESGVEWMGKIPTDWNIIRVKDLTRVKRGASPRPIADQKYFDENGEFGWVRIEDVTASEKYLEKTKEKLSELGASLSVKRYPGDLFLSIAGSVGKPIITKIKCCIHDGFVYFPNLKINPEFLQYIFLTGEPYKGLGKLGTQLNLNTKTVGEIPIAIPKTNSEIEKIIEFISNQDSKTKQAINNLEREISTLEEYRKSLIYAVVTGKVQVS